jgi:hypothetical protein
MDTEVTHAPHPSGRIQVLANPIALPGKCVICGASDNDDGRKYIDIGFELDFYGVFYFCTHCMSEMAASLGYISPSLFKVVEEENLEASNKIRELEAENVKLRVALNSVDFLGTLRAPSSGVADNQEPVEPKRSTSTKSLKSNNEPRSSNVSKSGEAEFADDIL